MSPNSAPRATDLQSHGIAVHNGSGMSILPHRDPTTGRDYAYVGVNSATGLVVQVDVNTGRTQQFTLPNGCTGPWGLACTLGGDLLVTTTGGTLVRIDPRAADVRAVGSVPAWIWTIDRGADGNFYLGTSGPSRLYRYNPQSHKIDEVADMSAYDKYTRVVLDGRDGFVYCSIGFEKAHLLAYHIASGKVTSLLPKNEVATNMHRLGRGVDGQVYVRTVKGNVYRVSHGEAFRVKNPRRDPQNKHEFADFALPSLPDGRHVHRVDPDAVRVIDGKKSKVIEYRYTTQGANIFHLAEGPKKAVYASTIMPLYMLRYDPSKKKLENLGRGGPDNGEAYSIGHVDGVLYYATYSTGQLMSYDPARPLKREPVGKTQTWTGNPKLIGHLGEGHCRPRAMCVDVRKRVWVGSHAEYGRRHGGLMCYDTLARKMRNNPVVIPDQSIQALAADDAGRAVYGGTDIIRGSGMDPVTKEAHLFGFDAVKHKLLWKLIPVPGENGIINLVHHNGKLYGTTRPKFTFFCFDLATRKMDYVVESKISACREQSMTLGPDGWIYGITWVCLFRWRLSDGLIQVLHMTTEEERKHYNGGSLFHRGAALIDGRLYFSCGPEVMSMKVPVGEE